MGGVEAGGEGGVSGRVDGVAREHTKYAMVNGWADMWAKGSARAEERAVGRCGGGVGV